ncbi:hypothetical protein HZB03_03255 [Candidatus Woesearchaeota archaeon]|nr:hypothetical protein [Candidatus Woesearchaeota archaeon]
MDKNDQHKRPVEDRTIIVRYGELALKGENRRYFESQLQMNMEKQLSSAAVDARVTKIRGRFFVNVPLVQTQKAIDVLRCVFGIVSVSPAYSVEATEDKVVACSIHAVAEYLSKRENHPVPVAFRVRTRRINKKFSLTSMEVDSLLGEKLLEHFPLKVRLTKPELVLGVELYDRAYIFTETYAGVGGLPVGVSGKVVVNVAGPFGVLAAFLMLKRGCETVLVASRDADVSSLQRYTPKKLTVHAVRPDEAQNVAQEKVYAFVDAVMGIPKKQEKAARGLVNLYPLIAWNEEQARAACKRYALACA